MNKTDFSEYIKTKRKELNMTQEELAEKLCVSRNVVAKWESGLRYPDLEISQRLAEVLLITPNELYEQSSVNDHSVKVGFKTIVLSVLAVLLLAGGIVLTVTMGTRNKSSGGDLTYPSTCPDTDSDDEESDAPTDYFNQDGCIEWFDLLDGGELETIDDFEIKELPGVILRFEKGNLKIVADGEESNVLNEELLPSGVLNAYFSDLTGDGIPELCTTVSFGSGIVDTRIIVIDLKEGNMYGISDRFTYNYVLRKNEGLLMVDRYTFEKETYDGGGVLSYSNGRLYMKEVPYGR